MNRCYPVCLNASGKKCVVIGGGDVAARKVSSLLECGARITLISPRITSELERLVKAGEISHVSRSYGEGDMEGAFLVIAATGDRELNRSVAEEAEELGILHNVVDSPENCSFFVPSVLRRGCLTVSISTNGRVPALSKAMRRKLEGVIGEEKYTRIANFLARARSELMEKVASPGRRKDILNRLSEMLLDGATLEAAEAVLWKTSEEEE